MPASARSGSNIIASDTSFTPPTEPWPRAVDAFVHAKEENLREEQRQLENGQQEGLHFLGPAPTTDQEAEDARLRMEVEEDEERRDAEAEEEKAKVAAAAEAEAAAAIHAAEATRLEKVRQRLADPDAYVLPDTTIPFKSNARQFAKGKKIRFAKNKSRQDEKRVANIKEKREQLEASGQQNKPTPALATSTTSTEHVVFEDERGVMDACWDVADATAAAAADGDDSFHSVHSASSEESL